MHHEMALHIVLLPAAARSDGGLADGAAWHLVDQAGSETWCGTAVEYGALQRPLGTDPDLDLCPFCARQGSACFPDLLG